MVFGYNDYTYILIFPIYDKDVFLLLLLLSFIHFLHLLCLMQTFCFIYIIGSISSPTLSLFIIFSFFFSFSHSGFGWNIYGSLHSLPCQPSEVHHVCIHLNAFIAFRIQNFVLILLSIADLNAFLAFTALSISFMGQERFGNSLVRYVFGVCIAKPTKGSSISFPCSVHCLFQVGFNTNFQGLPPCFIFKLKYVPGGQTSSLVDHSRKLV